MKEHNILLMRDFKYEAFKFKVNNVLHIVLSVPLTEPSFEKYQETKIKSKYVLENSGCGYKTIREESSNFSAKDS
jgi:hypothetical protein